MLQKLDKWWIGFTLSFINPIFCMYLFKWIKYPNFGNMQRFIAFLMRGNVLSHPLSLCVAANVGLMFVFMHKDIYKTSRAIVIVTMFMTIALVYVKFALEGE